jgi:hypothetical protein
MDIRTGRYWLMVPFIPFIYMGGMMLLTTLVIVGQLLAYKYRDKLPNRDKIRDNS